MFTICPECGNDKLKTRALEKREYDPATTRVTVHEEIAMVEYHCPNCGWIVLEEDPAMMPASLAKQAM